MHRRDLLSAIPIGAAMLAFGPGIARARTLNPSDAIAAVTGGQAPWWLFAPLKAGDEVGLGWRLDALSPVQHGASVLTLRKGAETARVHICAREGRARGIAASKHFDLLLMNDGDGQARTDESVGRVVKTLARYAARAEATMAPKLAEMREMMPHVLRVERYRDVGQRLA